MKNFKPLIAILLAFTLQSCFKDEADPLPTSGENSFSAKIDGNQFVAEDVHNFKNISYGITVYENDQTWLLRFTNSSNQTISIYLHEVEEVGDFNIGANDDYNLSPNSEGTISSIAIVNHKLNILYHTNLPELNETIRITKIEGDSIIIGEFNKITLSNPDSPEEKIFLTDGRFNINSNNLNNH